MFPETRSIIGAPERIRHGQSFNLTSPGYPNGYPGSARYTWLIERPQLWSVRFRLKLVDLESFSIGANKCMYDQLMVAGNGPYCSYNDTVNFDEITVDSGEYATVQFKSDRSVSKTGFLVEYAFGWTYSTTTAICS